MSSNRPYLLRALNEWINDNDMTPHLLVDASQRRRAGAERRRSRTAAWCSTSPRARLPRLDMDNRELRFMARFGGVSQSVVVPVTAILAIYAQETGQGMMLPEDGGALGDGAPGDAREPRSRPTTAPGAAATCASSSERGFHC